MKDLSANIAIGGDARAELQAVDVRLPSAREAVALEARSDILMRPDFRTRIAAREIVVDEGLGTEGVIAVAMRIDQKRERLVGNLANRVERQRTHLRGAGVGREHFAAAVCECDVGEAVEHRDARLDDFELAHHRIECCSTPPKSESLRAAAPIVDSSCTCDDFNRVAVIVTTCAMSPAPSRIFYNWLLDVADALALEAGAALETPQPSKDNSRKTRWHLTSPGLKIKT